MNSNVFRWAAQAVADGDAHYACPTLEVYAFEKIGSVNRSYLMFFSSLFEPEIYSAEAMRLAGSLWVPTSWWGNSSNYKNQLARSLALLLAAEIADEA